MLQFACAALAALTAQGPGPALTERTTDEPATAIEDPTDAELLGVWSKLPADRRREVVDYLELDLSHAETFQLGLARWVVAGAGIDPGLLDDAPAAVWFDPVVHAPAQPIERTLLDPDSKRAEKVRRAMRASFPERASEVAYRYDFGSREVVRVASPDDPTRRFHCALAGLPADWDLVEAFVCRALDDGSQTTVHAAFAHLYTERDGAAHPGITLYDAWCSGTSIEMPDVDCLGILHTVANDWTSWTAPVPEPRQAPLYDRIGAWFGDARRQRGLREALARCYLEADPAHRDGYTAGNDTGFHALWDRHSSVPSALAEALPDADGWSAFLERTNAELADDRAFWRSGEVRRTTLAKDRDFVRRRLVAIMKDLELLPAARTEGSGGGR
ncbi:MAG: hypothetical protein R3F34_00990 [Planctomycetota bacterium]